MEFQGFVPQELHQAAAVRINVYGFGDQIPVRTNEEQIIGDELEQHLDIARELRSPKASLHLQDLPITLTLTHQYPFEYLLVAIVARTLCTLTHLWASLTTLLPIEPSK